MPAANPAPVPDRPLRILAFGDSLMAGYGLRKGDPISFTHVIQIATKQ